MNKVTDEELDAAIDNLELKERDALSGMFYVLLTELRDLRKLAKQRWCSSELMDCNEKIVKYKEVLRWYGDEKNYEYNDVFRTSKILKDGGHRAQEILKP